MHLAWLWLAVLPVLLVLSGCAEPEPQDWPGRDLEGGDPPWRDTWLEPGHALEMDFPLRTGDSLEYDWFTMDRTRIPFEVHHHTPEGADRTSLSGTFYEHQGPFVAEASAMHSLLWKNLGDSPVELWIQVEGEQCYSGRCGTIVQL